MKKIYKKKAYRPSAGAIRTAVNIGRAIGGRIYSNYMKPKQTTSAVGVTTQHDRARVYRKKNMAKGRKTQWKKFVKKVEAVNLRDRGLTTALYNNLFDVTSVTAANQAIGEMHLYGFKSPESATAAGCNDIASVINNDFTNTRGTEQVAGSEVVGGTSSVDSIMFESAVLDATVSNTSDSTIELDVYTFVYKPFTKGNFNTLTIGLNQASTGNYTGVVQDLGTPPDKPGLSLVNRGCTPFELGKGISMTNSTILRKEKFLISPGQAITLQMRDPKNRRFNPQDFILSNNSFKYKNWTQSYLLIAKKVIENGTPTTFRMGVTRSYKYTKEGQKTNQSYRLTL